MSPLDLLTLALMIALPFGVGISPLLLPRARLRSWGTLLCLILLLAAALMVIQLRHAPHPYHYVLLLPFGIGWLLSAFLIPMRLRGK